VTQTVVDVAGASTGGAARWRRELKTWLASGGSSSVRVIGEHERVEPRWLVRREVFGRAGRRIAANNVSFFSGSGPRVVLLRNPLHFLRDGEAETLPPLPSSIRLQAPIVRLAARRAEAVVVPSSDMAERVVAAIPGVRQRIHVRFHPLGRLGPPRRRLEPGYILFPCLPAPHKDLLGELERLVAATDAAGEDLVVKVTADLSALSDRASSPRVQAVGPQSLEEIDHLWASAAMAYAPFKVESFGYPVAEGRAYGVPVIGPETSLVRELGGNALFAFDPRKPGTLPEAISRAASAVIDPDPDPFDPEAYFEWLTGL
jgi:glycosyltransferase involved in cell wall biosynthesis